MATVTLRLRALLTQREDHENRRIRLAEVAQATAISEDDLHVLLNNQVDQVSLAALCRLCGYFHCSPGDLLRLSSEDTPEDAVDARDIVHRWERQYGADEQPRAD